MTTCGEQPNYRMERVERLLTELRYEVERAMMEGDIEDETLSFRFIVPRSKEIPSGVVMCEFTTRPMPAAYVPFCGQAKLRVVK